MNRQEFGAVMAYLSAGIGKPIPQEMMEVYFDLLNDLPAPALVAAVQQSLVENEYPIIPSIGVIRKRAIEAIARLNEMPTAMEAWAEVRQAVQWFGYIRPKEGIESLRQLVRQTAKAIGWQSICDSTEPEIVRAQFCKAYEVMLARERREKLLPAEVKTLIASVGGMPLEPPAPDNRSARQIFAAAGIDISESRQQELKRLINQDKQLTDKPHNERTFQ